MSRDARTVRPFVLGIACFALLAILNQARGFELWRNYALSGVAMGSIVTWVLWRKDVRIPHYIQWVIVAGLLLHYGGGSLGSPYEYSMGLLGYHGINGAYHVHTWWDNLTHAVGIGAGAMAIAYLAEAYQMRRGLAWPGWAVAGTAFLGALAAGVGVELYEYLGKSVFQTIDQGGYENTMLDLHFNILGAALGTAVAVRLDRHRFAARIQRHWGGGATNLETRPWTARLPAGMAGFLAFAAVPAITSLALAIRFLVHGVPVDAIAAYDQALQLLLASAVAGAVLGPGLGWAWTRRPSGARA
jgi:hypothetical protein